MKESGEGDMRNDPSSPQNSEGKIRQFIQEIEKNINEIRIHHFLRHRDGAALPYVLEVRDTENLITIRLQGPIDKVTVPVVCVDFRGKLKSYLDKNILLDFSDVTDVDSATVANLIFLLNQLQQNHRKLGVIHAGSELENFIEIDKVKSLIHVYGSEEEALQDLT